MILNIQLTKAGEAIELHTNTAYGASRRVAEVSAAWNSQARDGDGPAAQCTICPGGLPRKMIRHGDLRLGGRRRLPVQSY